MTTVTDIMEGRIKVGEILARLDPSGGESDFFELTPPVEDDFGVGCPEFFGRIPPA
jgi:hypothetical protein